MYSIAYSTQFKKDLKKVKKQGKDMGLLNTVIKLLSKKGSLPKKYKEHSLKGNYKGCHECHLQPDWLLVWQRQTDVIILTRIGSHSDLF